MATEKRLIYANDLLDKAQWFEYQCDDEGTLYDSFKYIDPEDVENAPTVEAVEVVRCKDCKKWFRHTQVDRERGECRRYQTTKHENGFCDRGERKDNE